MRLRLSNAARLFGLIACLAPFAAHAATLEAGEGKPYPTPSAAIAAAHDGDTVRIAAGSYFDCAIVKASNLTIQGAGEGKTTLTDKPCQGKALLVVDGSNVTIRDMTLARARVPDFNGAGIRAQGGDLLVDHVHFDNDQEGILAGDLPGKTITVRNSAFTRNGTCEGGGCAHGIYVGHMKLLRVENSKFFETKQGHHIKSRAERTEVIGCDLRDGANGNASYAVEAPNGGSVIVRDSVIQKGPKSDNHTAAIIIGSEGVTQPTPEITVAHNTFTVEGNYNSFLVVNITATEAQLTGNTLQGNAKALKGDGVVR